MKGNIIHVIHKGVFGSGLTVVNQIKAQNKVIEVGSYTFNKLVGESNVNDRLVFHGRKALLNSILFLIYNNLFKRNKIIYNPHTNLTPVLKNKIVLNIFTDTILSFTEYNKKFLDAAGFKNVVVIPNPIPLDRLKCTEGVAVEKEYDFVWAGRNSAIKRMEIFINAFNNVLNINGLILADKFNTNQKKFILPIHYKLTAIEGTDSKTFFTELMKGKVFVFTSTDAEGFPLILMEVAYLGIPIVAPDTEKYREILGESAIYWSDEVDLWNKLHSIKVGILNPIYPEKLIEKYSPERITTQYEAIE